MAHSLNDLSALQDVALDDGNVASLDDLKETGSYLPMLQPGAYEFETPADMNLPWDTVEKEDIQLAQFLELCLAQLNFVGHGFFAKNAGDGNLGWLRGRLDG
jgi:hypothetical protein